MPTHSAHFSEAEHADVIEAAKAANEKVGPYVAAAVRQRMEAEGFRRGTPAHDVRSEALATAEALGPARVVALLREARQCAASTAGASPS